MPLYEYQCTACGKLTEKRQKFSDPELTECPYCGGGLERTITAPAIQFKGGGWYADLYSKGGSSGDAAKTANDSAKAEGGSSKAPASSTPARTAAAASSGGSNPGTTASATPSSSTK